MDWWMVSVLFSASQILIPSDNLWSLWTLSGIKSLCKYALTIYDDWMMIFVPFCASLIWLTSEAAISLDVVHRQLMASTVIMYIN